MHIYQIDFMNVLFVTTVIGLFSIWVTPIALNHVYITDKIRNRGR